jgi:hypothetical protein
MKKKKNLVEGSRVTVTVVVRPDQQQGHWETVHRLHTHRKLFIIYIFFFW